MSEAQAVTPGTYYIWSRVENAKGQRLAMTFNGNKQPITVTPLDTSNSKQRVRNFAAPECAIAVTDLDMIALVGDPGLQR